MGQLEQPLAAIMRAGLLPDELVAYQVAKNPAQALLGNPQNAEQLGYRHLRMAPDKMDHAMMGAAEAVFREDGVGLRGEIPIGEEQQLDPLTQLVLAQKYGVRWRFYVSHVDLFRNL